MALLTVFLMTMLFVSSVTALSINRHHDRRLFFDSHKTTTTTERPSFGHNAQNWFSSFLSGDSNKEDSSSKLALLKSLLSSLSNDKSSKLDTLFQILNAATTDNKNDTSANKLNRLLAFFSTSGSSSNNLQLAMKLISLAQGSAGLSSLTMSDMKSLVNFISG